MCKWRVAVMCSGGCIKLSSLMKPVHVEELTSGCSLTTLERYRVSVMRWDVDR
jgi:hypothetical protein